MDIADRILSWRKSLPDFLPTGLSWGFLVILAGLTFICVVNTFARHLTPDISIYLLQTRTFLQEFNRFIASHDSKGILLTFILAPAVRLFGPNMFAAAAAQLIAFAVAFTGLYFISRRYSGKLTAVIVSLLGVFAIHSYYFWEANARPEDFGLALIVLTLFAAIRGTHRFLAIAGAMTALSVFLKTTLVITPAVIVLMALLANAVKYFQSHGRKKPFRALTDILEDGGWVFGGFAIICVAVFGWLILFDSIQGWYRQTIVWPLEYRMLSAGFSSKATVAYKLLITAHIQPLLFAGGLGLVFGWVRGWRREAFLLAAAIAAEFYRVSIEGSLWNYLLVVMTPLLIVAAGMIGAAGSRRMRSVLVWLTPVIFLSPLIPSLTASEIRAFDLRVVQHLPSPSESFARLFRSYYRAGETIFPNYNDYQIILLMDAPRPAPILSCHFSTVSPEEQSAVQAYYASSPPDWVMEQSSQSETPLRSIVGGVNYSYYVQFPTPGNVPTEAVQSDSVQTGNEFSPMLPSSALYRLIVDNGYLQAWHLVKQSPDTNPDD